MSSSDTANAKLNLPCCNFGKAGASSLLFVAWRIILLIQFKLFWRFMPDACTMTIFQAQRTARAQHTHRNHYMVFDFPWFACSVSVRGEATYAVCPLPFCGTHRKLCIPKLYGECRERERARDRKMHSPICRCHSFNITSVFTYGSSRYTSSSRSQH